jgi:hypothetical protein
MSHGKAVVISTTSVVPSSGIRVPVMCTASYHLLPLVLSDGGGVVRRGGGEFVLAIAFEGARLLLQLCKRFYLVKHIPVGQVRVYNFKYVLDHVVMDIL